MTERMPISSLKEVKKGGIRLRARVLSFVGALILVSLLASVISLFQISAVNRTLDDINRISMPVSKLLAQIQIDAEVFRRETTRGLGSIHWNDPHWAPRPVPKWITDVIRNELDRARTLLATSQLGEKNWMAWVGDLESGYGVLVKSSEALYAALEKKDTNESARMYPIWNTALDDWTKQLQWGVSEHERTVREGFEAAQGQVAQLRTGLEMILFVVVGLSLLLLWLGERALRPLNELTDLVRQITRRGLKREDKALPPSIHLNRDDEVSQLAREFHGMATQILEWEKVVESQKRSLEDQNSLLKERVELQERLKQAEHLAGVGRLSAQVAHEVRNPLHSIGLEAEVAMDLASKASDPALKSSIQSILQSVDRLEKITDNYLKLSKMSSGVRTRVDLGEVFEQALANYASVFEKARVSVDWVRESKHKLEIEVDAAMLEQAIGNLIQNAIQAMDQNDVYTPKKIAIRLGSLESGRAYIRIEDSGPGIRPDVREKLFTPFVTTKAQGTGLGLSIVKKIIDDFDGVVRAVSPRVLKGAAFEILLPEAIRGASDVSKSPPRTQPRVQQSSNPEKSV